MSSKKPPLIRPGTPAPASAQYREVGPRGGNAGREVTVPLGHKLPPTTAPDRAYQISDRTDNKSGRKK